MKALGIWVIAALLLILASPQSRAAPEDDIEAASKAYYQGQHQEAAKLATRAIGSQKLSTKNFAVAYFIRGLAFRKLKQYDKALEDLTRVIDIDPEGAKGYNGLAWLLATCTEKKHRDGQRAVVLAKRAVSLQESSGHLDTLAAALAEVGQFAEAVRTQKLALEKLATEGRQSRARDFEARLAKYQKDEPWRDR